MDASPLPRDISVSQFRQLAKSLVKAYQTGEGKALRHLEEHYQIGRPLTWKQLRLRAGELLSGVSAAEHRVDLTLREAQLLVARSHGFEGWAALTDHVKALARPNSSVSHFEAAIEAIVNGNLAALESLVGKNPELVRARSTRTHQATLLHYLSANGVEDFRQQTPDNAVELAKALLHHGAEVDALAATYGGGRLQTTLNLLVSSVHPAKAGVQAQLAETLLDFGAAVNGLDDDGSPLLTALAFGYRDTAEALARRGARVDSITAAAGLGRLDLVRSFLNEDGGLKAEVPLRALPCASTSPQNPSTHVETALLLAARLGRTEVVEFLLEKGVALGARDDAGQTALHLAAAAGHLGLIRLLLQRGASLEAKNEFGGTVLGQTVWYRLNAPSDSVDYSAVIETLLAADAKVTANWRPTGDGPIDDALRQAELTELLAEVGRSREEGDGLTLAKALRRLGEFERGLPDLHAARRHYEEAVTALREAKEPLLLAHTVRHLGDVYYDAGRPGPAERCYDEALALYRAHDHPSPLDVANAIRSLAVLKDAEGWSEGAARLWEDARDLYVKVGVPAGVAESAARLALLAHGRGDLPLTRRWLDEASTAADAGEDPGTLRYVCEVRARVDGTWKG